jgi:hypothetical protein
LIAAVANGERFSKEMFPVKGETAEGGRYGAPYRTREAPRSLDRKVSFETFVTVTIDGPKR